MYLTLLGLSGRSCLRGKEQDQDRDGKKIPNVQIPHQADGFFVGQQVAAFYWKEDRTVKSTKTLQATVLGIDVEGKVEVRYPNSFVDTIEPSWIVWKEDPPPNPLIIGRAAEWGFFVGQQTLAYYWTELRTKKSVKPLRAIVLDFDSMMVEVRYPNGFMDRINHDWIVFKDGPQIVLNESFLVGVDYDPMFEMLIRRSEQEQPITALQLTSSDNENRDGFTKLPLFGKIEMRISRKPEHAGWACSQCTYINKPNVNYCDVCLQRNARR
jgi:hypothetical protein